MRFLGDYSSDEEQYKALMNDGATFAKTQKLRPGVALTAEQVAQLTSDIVWMVEQEITLPNGSKTKALVPQVYVKVKPGDIDGSGALLAGRNVDIKTDGNLDNSGTIAGRKIVALNANNVNNLGRITGQQVGLTAKEDINVIGGTVDASQKLVAVAGRDVNVTTTTSTGKNAAGNVSSTIVDRVAGLYVTGGTGGTLYVSADRDVNLKAATVSNASLATGGLTNADKSANTEGLTAIVAKRDINLGTVTTASTQNLRRDDVTYRNESLSRDIGSSITGAGNIALQAGNDIYAKAATVQAGGVLSATAAGNLVISAGQDKTSVAGGSQSVSRGFLSKTTTTSTYDNQNSTLVGSSFVGAKGTNLEASYGTLAIEAATIGSKDSKTTLTGADVDIRSGVNQSTSQTTSSSSSSGLGKIFGSGNGEGSSESSQTSLALTTIDGKGVSIQATGNAGIGGKLPGDINLTAVKINPNEAEGGKLDLSAKGDLNLASITTTDYAKSESKGSSLLWQSAEGKGHVNDSVHYNQIQVDPKNINLNIGNKITADMSVKDSVAVLASQPQLAYMAKIINDPALSNKVNWTQVQEAHDQWDYKQSGLTPAAGAIVALAVAVATSGAGANAVGLMTGTSSSTALASYGVSTAAMQAAITTLASKATVSMINNQGDLGAVFNELGSSDSIKQLATAVITAGAVSALGSAIQIQGDNGMMSLDQVTAKTGGGGLVANIGKNLINGVARATITSAITNTSLEQSLRTEIIASVLNAASASGANAVGDAASGGIDAAGNTVSPSLNEFGRALAHAVVGCMAGAAGAAANASSLSSGNGCSAGAIGAVVGELSATYFNSDLAVGEKQKVNTVEFASLMAGIAGALTGQGPDAIAVAASTGGNAAANNYLNHVQWTDLAKALQDCGADEACKTKVNTAYTRLSQAQDAALATCDSRNDCTVLKSEVAAGTAARDSLINSGALSDGYAGANNLQYMGQKLSANNTFRQQVGKAVEYATWCGQNTALCNQDQLKKALAIGSPAIAAMLFANPAVLYTTLSPLMGERGVSALIGGGVSAVAQYLTEGGVKVPELLAAMGTAALSSGLSLVPTIAINTTGSLATSAWREQDASTTMFNAGVTATGSLLGYGVGAAVVSKLNPVVNPWYRPDWITTGPFGMQSWNASSQWPARAGNAVGTAAQESWQLIFTSSTPSNTNSTPQTTTPATTHSRIKP